MIILAGQAQSRGETPQAIVEMYCSFDAQGANFSASNPNANAILGLLINEDEAGYDESVIIRSYKIGKSKIEKRKAEVEVIYTVLGIMGSEFQMEKYSRKETMIFRLRIVENSWKIDGLRMRPHISRAWMLEHLRRDLREDERAKKNDPQLKAAIIEIANW
jgi:hypothetical protein